MYDRLRFNPDTIRQIYFFELRYASRENSLKILFFLPTIIILLFLMVGEFKHLVFGINVFHVLIGIFLFDSELFINQFSIIKRELKILRFFPIPRISLFLAKNFFALTFVLFQFLIIIIIFFVFKLIQISILEKALIYFGITFPILLGIGNLLSILMPRGHTEERKKETLLSSIIIPIIVILLSSVPYHLFRLLTTGLQSWQKTGVTLLFMILSLFAYFFSLIQYAELLNKNIFNLLEKL